MSLLIGWLGFSLAVGLFASVRRHRSGIGWFFVSILISPLIAFVLLLILLPLDPARHDLIEHQRSEGGVSEPVMAGVMIVVVLLVLALFGSLLIPAKAQQQTPTQQVIRDASGQVVITSTQSGNQTTYRDSGGRTVGTSTIDNIGNTILRDAAGRTVGTINGRK